MPVCTWVCALSFGRCRMSTVFLLVYFCFFGSLRPSLFAERRWRWERPISPGYAPNLPPFEIRPCLGNTSAHLYHRTEVAVVHDISGCRRHRTKSYINQVAGSIGGCAFVFTANSVRCPTVMRTATSVAMDATIFVLPTVEKIAPAT